MQLNTACCTRTPDPAGDFLSAWDVTTLCEPLQTQVKFEPRHEGEEGHALMVVSSEPEKTRSGEAAKARTAPEWPVSVARHARLSTSHTRTCRPTGEATQYGPNAW